MSQIVTSMCITGPNDIKVENQLTPFEGWKLTESNQTVTLYGNVSNSKTLIFNALNDPMLDSYSACIYWDTGCNSFTLIGSILNINRVLNRPVFRSGLLRTNSTVYLNVGDCEFKTIFWTNSKHEGGPPTTTIDIDIEVQKKSTGIEPPVIFGFVIAGVGCLILILIPFCICCC